jgi:hypothetical protein
MVHFNRRRVRTRRFTRPSRPEPVPAAAQEKNSASTEFDLQPLNAPPPASPHSGQKDSTVTLEAVRLNADPNEETAEGFPVVDSQPEPPKRLEFTCPCGARLIATTEIYDKHSRCAMCQTVMLLNLVFDPEQNTHEIVPFRVNPGLGP